MTNPLTVEVVGLVWYELADYPSIKALMVDSHVLPATYTQWRMQAEQTEKTMRRSGKKTVRAVLRPAEFSAWCQARGLNVNAQARNQFAISVALEAHRHLGGGAAGSA